MGRVEGDEKKFLGYIIFLSYMDVFNDFSGDMGN